MFQTEFKNFKFLDKVKERSPFDCAVKIRVKITLSADSRIPDLEKGQIVQKTVFLANGDLGPPQASPRPPIGPDMILGHYGLARDCVWSSGAARAALGGRGRRLLDLKARRSEVGRVTRGADPESKLLANFSKIEKMTDFQSALFGLKIELDGLWVCTSHGAASFGMKII